MGIQQRDLSPVTKSQNPMAKPSSHELTPRCSTTIRGTWGGTARCERTCLAPRGLHKCIKSSPTTSVTTLERLEAPTTVLASSKFFGALSLRHCQNQYVQDQNRSSLSYSIKWRFTEVVELSSTITYQIYKKVRFFRVRVLPLRYVGFCKKYRRDVQKE